MHLGVVPKVRHLRNQTWAGYIRSLLSGLGSNGRLPTASSDFGSYVCSTPTVPRAPPAHFAADTPLRRSSPGYKEEREGFLAVTKNRKIAKLGREIEVAGGSEVAQVFYGWGTRSLLSGLGSNGGRDERGFSGALVRR